MMILATAMAAMMLVGCADKVAPASTRLLDMARPKEAAAPSTAKVETRVSEAGKSATRASNEVVNAKRNVVDLEARLAEGKVINAEFSEAIKELSEEHQARMNVFHKRFAELAARSKETIEKLTSSLDLATGELLIVRDQLGEAERELVILKSDNDKLLVELVDYRAKWTILRDAVKENEAARDSANTERDEWMKKAKSREKYVWFFWSLVGLVIVAAVLKFKFRLF